MSFINTLVEVPELEMRARRMFAAYLSGDENWSANKTSVAMVFKAMWSSSLSIEQIDAIGTAMSGFPVNLEEACNQLVRARVLRAKRIHGKKHYEVNF